MNIVFPSDTGEVIDAIRLAIGRNVTFYSEHKVPCSACSIDPITNTSINSFCTVCSGVGYVVTLSGYTELAHITHNPQDIVKYTPGGSYVDGDCLIQTKYTSAIMTIVNRSKFVNVDGTMYTIKTKTPRGFPLNRVIFLLKERD